MNRKRKSLIIVAAAVVLSGVVAALLAAFAIYNLNSLIERNQTRILRLVSEELKRPVQVDEVSARAGFGVWIEIGGLKIAEDPAFGQLPFLSAPRATLEVDLLPILRGAVRVHTMTLINPDVRLLENAAGVLNTDSIGGPPGQHNKVSLMVASLFVNSVEVDDATIHYSRAGQPDAPIEIRHLDGKVSDFGLLRRVHLDGKFAFLEDAQNLSVSGIIGPLLHRRIFDTASIPLDIEFEAQPLVADKLKALGVVGTNIPEGLSIPDAAQFNGSLKGTMDSLNFDLSANLGSGRINYSTIFAKPANLPMTVTAKGAMGLVSDRFNLDSVHVRLADLDATLSEMAFPSSGPSHLRIETNAFDVAALGSTLPFLGSYHLTGKGQARVSLTFGNTPFSSDGSVSVTDASVIVANGKVPSVSNLDATAQLRGQTLVLKPSTFSIASARATLQGAVNSFNPLQATYQLDAQSIRPAALIPSRPPAETVNQVHIAGNAHGEFSAPRLSTRITSSDGLLFGAAYRNLDLMAGYNNSRLTANPLTVAVFSGSLVAAGGLTMGLRPQFNVNANLRGINVHQAFLAIDPKTQRRLRGFVTGNLNLGGAGKDWNAIKPTLTGNGDLALTNGKVAGVNIVAVAIDKIASAPGVSQIVNATFMSDHRGMLADPDTQVKYARSTFVVASQRITTHDLIVKSDDYGITGDGWFDFDNNISMSMDIQLTFGLSVTIPVYVTGQTPVVVVVPDIPKLAERIALGALSVPGRIIRGGVNGLSNLIGGSSSSGSRTPSSSNPLDELKGLLP
ncbi:MAG: hypothetical protein JO121_27470 [Deltaproteobacteria bacterium]|nr:hypothetical protein [Deltaproteobacteria bacterium]